MTEIGSDSNEKFAVLSIFAFSILYRILLVQVDPYPPSSDIGLHESLINSIILKDGNFTWNYYHMGGGPSLTHPGFHVFLSFIMLITGMPDYVAQFITAVLFSSLIVLCAFLLTKSLWGLRGAPLIAAFMVGFSRLDIEIVLWGGYPNIVTLLMIPLVFYVFLRKDLSPKVFLVISSLLISAIFFTHSLSALVFIFIAFPYILIELLISKEPNEKNAAAFFALSIFLGILLILPYVVEVFPIYLENIGQGMFVGGIDENKEALFFSRRVPILLVFASLIPAFSIFAFSKKYRGTTFDRVSILFTLWILVPAFATQAYLLGLYTDYYRLPYFFVMPLIIFTALFVDHGIGFLARTLERVKQNRRVKINSRTFYCFSISVILISLAFCFSPFFTGPAEGFSIAGYYDVVSQPEFTSLMWIRQRTSENAVFVSQHGYGWWLSGFGQRATLSAVEPQFLIIPHEFEAANIARMLLDTDFALNNGLIEIRDDGGYVGRHNPILLIDSEKFPDPYPIFYLNESEITIFYRNGVHTEMVDAAAIPVKDIIVEFTPESACISIIKENENIILTRKTEIFKVSKFGTFSVYVESVGNEISLEYVRLMLRVSGKIFILNQTVGVLHENAKMCGQIIFEEKTPSTKLYTPAYPTCLELMYNVENARKMEIRITMGGFEVEKVDGKYVQSMLVNMTSLRFMKEENFDSPIRIFDYRETIKQKGISFVACRRKECEIAKFSNDPMFNLVFINDNVAIFKVRDSG